MLYREPLFLMWFVMRMELVVCSDFNGAYLLFIHFVKVFFLMYIMGVEMTKLTTAMVIYVHLIYDLPYHRQFSSWNFFIHLPTFFYCFYGYKFSTNCEEKMSNGLKMMTTGRFS